MGKQATPVTERLRKLTVISDDGCHVYTGTKAGRGYGQMWVPGGDGWRKEYVHRVAWELANGPVPEGKHVLHKCDNRRCVNIEHLFVGTNLENRQDSVAKRRHAFGERAGGAKLTSREVVAIRRLYTSGMRIAAIARVFGLTHDNVESVVHFRTWRHLPAS